MSAPRHPDSLRQRLAELFASARLPTSPAVARRILRLIEDPLSTAAQFASMIEADPALAARLLRLANSAAYAQRRSVTTIRRAVTVVGLGQLRAVALGFELVGHLDRLGGCAFDLPSFWHQAALRGCLARHAALRVVPALADEAFLVGLLQECGVLPLVQGFGAPYAELYRRYAGAPAIFHAEERKLFPYTHVDAIAALAELWQFPESITAPLTSHHRRVRLGAHSPDPARLAAIGSFVGGLEFDGRAPAPPPAPLLEYARRELRLDETALERCFEEAVESYRRLAPLLEHDGEELEVTELLISANRHLQQQASDVQQRMAEIEQERDRVLDEQLTLRSALGRYREQAARDPLTGLLNRRALLEEADRTLRRAAEAGGAVAVIFLDIDDFKAINDGYGHDTGDRVLLAAANIAAALAGDDGTAGRWGGEELVLILPAIDEAGAERAAATLRQRLRAGAGAAAGIERPITASIGALWCPLEPGADPAPLLPLLISAADELMYAAKRGGKDRVCFLRRATHELQRMVGEEGTGISNFRFQISDGETLKPEV